MVARLASRGGKLFCLWRSHFDSAFDPDTTSISRGSLSGSGRLLGRARRLLLADRDTAGDLVNGSRHLLLTGSDLPDALPHRVEVA